MLQEPFIAAFILFYFTCADSIMYGITTIYYNYLSSISKKCHAVWHNKCRMHHNVDKTYYCNKVRNKTF